MNEVAEPTPYTSLPTIEPTTRLPEIGHRAQFAIYRLPGIPPRVQRITSCLCAILVLKPRIHVPNQVIIIVITHYHLLHLAILAHLAPKVLVEGIEVILELGAREAGLVVVGWVLVEVGQEDGLRVGGFDVFARAAVAVAAGSDFVVEGAVDFVLFCAEDGCEVIGHDRLLT